MQQNHRTTIGWPRFRIADIQEPRIDLLQTDPLLRFELRASSMVHNKALCNGKLTCFMRYMSTAYEEPDAHELLARLSLMEGLIEQGRETACRWGEFAVLWGTGTLSAFLWSHFSHTWHPWLWLTVICYPASVLLWIRRWRIHRNVSQIGRFVNALRMASGFAMNIGGLVAGFSPHISSRAIYVMIFLLMGTAHAASGFAFRWPLQIAVASLWWTAALLFPFVSPSFVFWIYCSTFLVGELGFGLYLMITERKYQYA